MNIRYLVMPQEGEFAHRLLMNGGRVSLYAAVAIAVVMAVFALVSETAPRQSVASSVSVAPPPATEKFEYFPDLYQNQAKHIEEPIATF